MAQQFVEDGPAGLADQREDNGETKADEDFQAVVLQVVGNSSPRKHGYRRPTWTQELLVLVLKKETGIRISRTTMCRLLQQLKIRLGRPKPIEGVHQGQQLVPKRFFRDIRENASTDLDLLQNDTSSEKTAYRSYFYLSPDKSAISAGGHLGQHCSINYRDKTVMIWYASFHPDDRLAAQISALADTTEQISRAVASH